MEITGEFSIPAPRQQVWEALNDPDMLRQSIPGCETLKRLSDTEFDARIVSKIGPVKAKFATRITLSDIEAPQSYTIGGIGQGGVAGFAKGEAHVILRENGASTVLHYSAHIQVGGKLAHVGSRLLKGTVRKLSDEFFGKFARSVGAAPASKR
jgi:carbon monoxide dehydrogenase subunit G